MNLLDKLEQMLLNMDGDITIIQSSFFPLLQKTWEMPIPKNIKSLLDYIRKYRWLLEEYNIYFNTDCSIGICVIIDASATIQGDACAIAFNTNNRKLIKVRQTATLYASCDTQADIFDYVNAYASHSSFITAYDNTCVVACGDSVIDFQSQGSYTIKGDAILLSARCEAELSEKIHLDTAATRAVLHQRGFDEV